MSDPLQIKRLLRRPQFLAAAKGVSEARGGVVIQRLERGDGSPHVGMGFTANLLVFVLTLITGERQSGDGWTEM